MLRITAIEVQLRWFDAYGRVLPHLRGKTFEQQLIHLRDLPLSGDRLLAECFLELMIEQDQERRRTIGVSPCGVRT